jgi:iron complex outermembrane receptor protein
MNGLVDYALLPLIFFDDVKIIYGASAPQWGSGAVAGAIHLNSKPLFNQGIRYSSNTSVGSFMDKQQQLKLEVSGKRCVSIFKFFNHSAQNNFAFVNTAQHDKPQQYQRNAELKQVGFMQENNFKLNNKSQASIKFWYQTTDRNIPASMTQSSSRANQKDESYRVCADWQRIGNVMQNTFRLAYIDEQLNYNDTSVALNSISKSQVMIAELENQVDLTKFGKLNISINNTYSVARANDYSQNPTQNRFAVFAIYKYSFFKNKWNALINFRKEIIQTIETPVVYGVGMEGALLKMFAIKANAGKHYRIPTFNDLYWTPGGNKELKPESGWSEDLTIAVKLDRNRISGLAEVCLFNRTINNWIMWLPQSNNIWSPQNVLEVWSRGVEYKLSSTYSLQYYSIKISGQYNYLLSTNEKSINRTDASLGKQLIYVPMQNAQVNFQVRFYQLSLSYTHTYNGYRYTSSDNSTWLRPFQLGNARINYTFNLPIASASIYFVVNNCWNQTYQLQAYRAMPLRNYQVGLALNFNYKNKNK